MVNLNKVNQLLKYLGHTNISVTNKPIFYWNGNEVTDDRTATIRKTGTIKLDEKFGFDDFLAKYSDNKIVFAITTDGELIDSEGKIRVFVD